MSRRITLFRLVDVDWMHFEVGLKRACWFYADIKLKSFKVKVSRGTTVETDQFSPSRTRTYMLHATVALTAQYLNVRQHKLGTIIVQTV